MTSISLCAGARGFPASYKLSTTISAKLEVARHTPRGSKADKERKQLQKKKAILQSVDFDNMAERLAAVTDFGTGLAMVAQIEHAMPPLFSALSAWVADFEAQLAQYGKYFEEQVGEGSVELLMIPVTGLRAAMAIDTGSDCSKGSCTGRILSPQIATWLIAEKHQGIPRGYVATFEASVGDVAVLQSDAMNPSTALAISGQDFLAKMMSFFSEVLAQSLNEVFAVLVSDDYKLVSNRDAVYTAYNRLTLPLMKNVFSGQAKDGVSKQDRNERSLERRVRARKSELQATHATLMPKREALRDYLAQHGRDLHSCLDDLGDSLNFFWGQLDDNDDDVDSDVARVVDLFELFSAVAGAFVAKEYTLSDIERMLSDCHVVRQILPQMQSALQVFLGVEQRVRQAVQRGLAAENHPDYFLLQCLEEGRLFLDALGEWQSFFDLMPPFTQLELEQIAELEVELAELEAGQLPDDRHYEDDSEQLRQSSSADSRVFVQKSTKNGVLTFKPNSVDTEVSE